MFFLLKIYGDGKQTRSFQYVDDLVDGLVLLMNCNYTMPINIGNDEEYTIEEFAVKIRDLVGNDNEIVKLKAVVDDPRKRRPNITVAMRELGWRPKTKVVDGLKNTIKYFASELEKIKNEGSNVDYNNLSRRLHLHSDL